MIKYLNLFLLSLLLLGCKSAKISNKGYQSETLQIQKIADHVYQHVSFLQTQSFGKVSCNGMIVVSNNEAIVFDTPSDNKASLELVQWVEKTLHAKIKAIVPTHFHNDCLGGLEVFHQHQIPSYANQATIQLARSNESIVPQHGFDGMLELKVGNKKVIARFLGEGHTKDNVIGYFPEEEVIFGGCLIKETGAGKGFLGDANVNEWPQTVAKLKEAYPKAKVVIPGHGKPGGTDLLDYTIRLFEQK